MNTNPPTPSVAFLFDLKSLRDRLNDDDALVQMTAQKTGEIVDFANNQFQKEGADVRIDQELHETPTKGAFVIATEILITLTIVAKAAKPFIEAIAILIGKLNERFPNNEFDLSLPNGTKMHVKGRLSNQEFIQLEESVISHLRDTDLSIIKKAEKPTYTVTVIRRDSNVQ